MFLVLARKVGKAWNPFIFERLKFTKFFIWKKHDTPKNIVSSLPLLDIIAFEKMFKGQMFDMAIKPLVFIKQNLEFRKKRVLY